MNKEFIEKIKDELNKCGFPHELDVVNRIKIKEHTVIPNVIFVGEDNKVHEIDNITLIRDETDKNLSFGKVMLDLIMECKTSKSRPWVFFREADPFLTNLIDGLVHKAEFITDLKSNISV